MDIGDRMGGVPEKSNPVPSVGCLIAGIGAGGSLTFFIIESPTLMRIFLIVFAGGLLLSVISWAIGRYYK